MNHKPLFMVFFLAYTSFILPCAQPHEEKVPTLKNPDQALFEYARKHIPFQDIIINNQIIFKSRNSDYCAKRYNLITSHIKQWNSRFNDNNQLSMIDLGAAQGYFSFKLAHELKINAVMVEDGQSACTIDNDHRSYLKDLCKANERCNVFLLAHNITSQNLHYLNLFDHFNIVLALNVLHYLKNWKDCLQLILELGDLIFIEVPFDDADKTVRAIHDYLETLKSSSVELFTKPSGNQTALYIFEKKQKRQPKAGLTYFNYIQGNCLWPEVKQTSLSKIPRHCAPSEVTINHRGEVALPHGVHIRSRL
jgi:hypothetical protein